MNDLLAKLKNIYSNLEQVEIKGSSAIIMANALIEIENIYNELQKEKEVEVSEDKVCSNELAE